MDLEDSKKIVIGYSSIIQDQNPYSFYLTSVRARRGRITSPIFLHKDKYYLQCNLSLMAGDIVRIGDLDVKYRILDRGKLLSRKGGISYRLKRLDEEPISQIDIDNSKKGAQIHLKNTPTSDEVLQMLTLI